MASSALKHVSRPARRTCRSTHPAQVIAPTTLQQAQTDALLALLNLSDPTAPSGTATQPKSAPAVKTPSSTAPLVWKVLVLDQQTKDVLATVLRVQDLRDAGVTLHVCAAPSCLSSSSCLHCHSQLHSQRPPLPDVPAVYFVAPTLANIRRISEDLDKCLYESFHLNFVEPLPRALLEELAASVATSGTGELVEQVGLLTFLRFCGFYTNAHAVYIRLSTSINHLSHHHPLYFPCCRHCHLQLLKQALLNLDRIIRINFSTLHPPLNN